MTTLLGIVGAAVLFALFGWFMRDKRLSCGGEGPCPSITGDCARCGVRPDPLESEHVDR